MDFFYGTQQVLFDVNLEVPEGEIVALLGHQRRRARARCCGPWPGSTTPIAGSSASSAPTAPTSSPSRSSTWARRCSSGGKMTFPGLTRPGQPAHRGALLPARRPSGQGRPRRGRRPLPRARGPPRPAGGHPVGRRAADAGAGPGHDDQAPAAHDRRARLRSRPDDRGAPHGHRPPGERRRRHGHPRRAERQPRHDAWPSTPSSSSGARSASTGSIAELLDRDDSCARSSWSTAERHRSGGPT